MSNYLTYAVLEQRMTAARLQALAGTTGTNLSNLVNEVIQRAEGLINSYAARRFQVPLPAGDLLEEWSLCIAEYELYKRGPGSNVPEKIKESYQNCLVQLRDLADGRINPGITAVASSRQSCQFTGGESLFDQENMNGY